MSLEEASSAALLCCGFKMGPFKIRDVVKPANFAWLQALQHQAVLQLESGRTDS